MKTIDERLEELTKKISSDEFQKSYGLGNEVDFHVFDYDPEDEYKVREHLKYLESKKDLNLKVFDIYEVIIEILKEKGFLEKVFEFEEKKGTKYVNSIISKTLGLGTSNDLIVKKIKNEIEPNQIIIITGIGKSYTIVRGHNLLNSLHSVVTCNPLIMFYPGMYDGQSFRLFNISKSENYYRAFQFVGRK